MEVDRPGPGEELNDGDVTEPRQAATAMVLRDGSRGLEVLLVRRNPDARFMGDAWVFPGGALQPADRDHAAAAVREVREEAGLDLDTTGALVPFSRWITPAALKVRFDTLFFVAAAPHGAEARVDGAECVEARWTRPGDALDAAANGQMTLVFPTIKHLEELAALESVDAALGAARTREVVAVEPRVVAREGGARVVLPGEPGYE
ncbi:MAG: NUDIX hydrolase [Actinobacteria bacterium]|nr:NUDIX hydrolase [Actinomycetota bacterium]